MNIHITDINLFNRLRASTLVEIEVGSRMYGLSHSESDKDILCIYAESENETNTIFTTHHQIQYKAEGIDYIFMSVKTFLRNAISGDATMNFEVINSVDLCGTCLEFLYDMRKSFYNYKIIRSYLGFAKRDIKRIDIDGNTNFTKNKKVAHAYRGLIFADKIFKNKEIFFDRDELDWIKNTIWNIADYKGRHNYSNELLYEIEELRKRLNKALDDKKLCNIMKVEDQIKLDKSLNKLFNSEYYKSKIMDNFDMTMIYEANENGVSYE